RPQALWTRSLLLVFAVGLLALIAPGAGAYRPVGKPSGQSVAEMEQSYQQERQAAEKTGLTKMFSPEWFERNDSFGQGGVGAVEGGRAQRGPRRLPPGAVAPAVAPPAAARQRLAHPRRQQAPPLRAGQRPGLQQGRHPPAHRRRGRRRQGLGRR